MECSLQNGRVQSVCNRTGKQELVVEVQGKKEQAINYPRLTGPCSPGDKVLLNTTAQELNLGTGGWHYVLAVCGQERRLTGNGHIMKLRYTPLQGRLLSVEEEESPYHHLIKAAGGLEGLPVAVGSLHSMLAPFVYGLQTVKPACNLAYLMSDGACLPLAFSDVVRDLQGQGLLQKTITFGNAFGGDLEAVNIYSALLAAKHVLKADAAIVLMGPGVVGTGTKWGTTALEQGLFLNAAQHLQGTPLAIARLSSADQRKRHRGWSHHTLTVLKEVAQGPVHLGLPNYLQSFPTALREAAGMQHLISWQDTKVAFKRLLAAGYPFQTMGRGPDEDPLFFHGVLAAALRLAELLF